MSAWGTGVSQSDEFAEIFEEFLIHHPVFDVSHFAKSQDKIYPNQRKVFR